MKIYSPEAQKLKLISLIITEEASMLSCHALRCIDVLLREVTRNQCPFRRKLLLLGGDFRQFANVVLILRGTTSGIEEACIKSSYLWNNVILKFFKKFAIGRIRCIQSTDTCYWRWSFIK